MIGLDTNVLLRLFAQDDPAQAAKVVKLFQATLTSESRAHVTTLVLAETVWVLQRAYRATREELGQVVQTVLLEPRLAVEQQPVVWLALRDFLNGASDFVDCLIARVNVAAGCTHTVTFDRKAARSPGFELLS